MNHFPPRNCPVCLGRDRESLFHQDFFAFSEGGLMEGYDLAVCGTCGAGYADNIPAQAVFDTYYADMSKYENSATGGKLSETNADRFRSVVDLVAPNVRTDESIADIGCATGGLLAEFKRRGFGKVMGFDPSAACAAVAQATYGIEVRTVPIGGLANTDQRFDAVILTGVLEHLRDLDSSLSALLGMLNAGGRIYIEVPDATRYAEWFSAPFQFLSMEHVNFFSPTSLANLFLRFGMQPVFVKRVDRFLSPNAGEPAVAGLFQMPKGGAKIPRQLARDEETKPALEKYLAQSREQDARIAAVIRDLVSRRVPLAVWGTGTHTLRLLKTGQLAQANIVAFIDSNSRYHGKTLHGVPIVAPETFARPEAEVLISSHVAEREIKKQIETSLRWPNKVICLYEQMPVALGRTVESL